MQMPLLVYLARQPARLFRRWSAEVTDPASPVAGLAVVARSRRAALRRLAVAAAHELGWCERLPCEVEVIEWRTATYSVTSR